MKLRVPKMPSRSPKLPRGNVQLPPFVADTMRDLRDRRLIVPVIALVVGIIAVPLVLRSQPEPAPSAVPLVLPEGAEQVLPAVLTEQQVGVRDYRERLDELKSKNPFKQQFQLSPKEINEASTLIETPAADSSAVPADTTTSPSIPTSDTSSTPDETVEPVTPEEPSASEDEILVLAPRIDLRFGGLGELKKRNDVGLGDILPSRKHPVVSLVAVSDDLKEASFIVSSSVTSASGEGKCSPKRSQCEFLILKEGEAQRFRIGEQGAIRRIVIDDIREEIVDRRKVEDE